MLQMYSDHIVRSASLRVIAAERRSWAFRRIIFEFFFPRLSLCAAPYPPLPQSNPIIDFISGPLGGCGGLLSPSFGLGGGGRSLGAFMTGGPPHRRNRCADSLFMSYSSRADPVRALIACNKPKGGSAVRQEQEAFQGQRHTRDRLIPQAFKCDQSTLHRKQEQKFKRSRSE